MPPPERRACVFPGYGKLRIKATSIEKPPGPVSESLPAFPYVPGAFTLNAAWLNHWRMEGLVTCGSPTTFGRSAPTPVSDASVPLPGENEKPLRLEMIEENCQEPKTLRPAGFGSWAYSQQRSVENLPQVGLAVAAVGAAVRGVLIGHAGQLRIEIAFADAVRPGVVRQHAEVVAQAVPGGKQQAVVVGVGAVVGRDKAADGGGSGRIQQGEQAACDSYSP